MKVGRIIWFNETVKAWEGMLIKQLDDDLWKFPAEFRTQRAQYLFMYIEKEKNEATQSRPTED